MFTHYLIIIIIVKQFFAIKAVNAQNKIMQLMAARSKHGTNGNTKNTSKCNYKNLAIANRSRVSGAHNTLRASIGLNIKP